MERSTMEYKGFKAKIMEAQKLTGDHVHGLPPGSPLDVYHSEEFVNYPEHWMKGPGVFVVAVRPNKGLWFDWTMNQKKNTAIVPTVKGCNPITGLQTSGIHMERYDTKCPKHGIEFKGDRFCPECGYKWPTHNYVSYPNYLWWDGFLNTTDGSVRQFFFTEDEMRDVATHMIGKENTVPAFGFAFFRPKEARAEDVETTRGVNWYWSNNVYYNSIVPDGNLLNTYCDYSSSDDKYGAYLNEVKTSGITLNSSTNNIKCSASYSASNSASSSVGGSAAQGHAKGISKESLKSVTRSLSQSIKYKKSNVTTESLITPQAVKEVSIGAGAKINQTLTADPYALDTWKDTPDASMVIYFVFEEKLNELKAGGMVDLVGKKEGMLDGIPVG